MKYSKAWIYYYFSRFIKAVYNWYTIWTNKGKLTEVNHVRLPFKNIQLYIFIRSSWNGLSFRASFKQFGCILTHPIIVRLDTCQGIVFTSSVNWTYSLRRNKLVRYNKYVGVSYLLVSDDRVFDNKHRIVYTVHMPIWSTYSVVAYLIFNCFLQRTD